MSTRNQIERIRFSLSNLSAMFNTSKESFTRSKQGGMPRGHHKPLTFGTANSNKIVTTSEALTFPFGGRPLTRTLQNLPKPLRTALSPMCEFLSMGSNILKTLRSTQFSQHASIFNQQDLEMSNDQHHMGTCQNNQHSSVKRDVLLLMRCVAVNFQ